MTLHIPIMDRLRLRWKFVLLISVVFLVIAGFFLIFIPITIEEIGDNALVTKSRVVTAMTAANVLPAVIFQDSEQIMTELKTAQLSPDVIYAVVTDKDGIVSGAIGLSEAESHEYRHTPEEGRRAGNDRIWQTVIVITHRDVAVGTLYMGFSRESIYLQRDRARRETALVTVLVFLFGLVSVIAISGAVTSQLGKMAEVAHDVTRGDLTVRAPESGGDEVGALARTLNAMLDRLAEAQHRLGEMNRELEDRVDIRTGELEAEVIEHRRTEEALRVSEERERQIIDLVPNLVFVKDAAGRYLVANAAVARFYGTTVEALQGALESDLNIAPADLDRYRAEDLYVIEKGIPKFIPEVHEHAADGSVRILQSAKIPITFSGMTSRCVLGVATDITMLKEVEQELTMSLLEKDVLLKEVHHRVKNNLQVINSLLSLQAQEVDDPILREAMVESQNRIRSMAMVHEQLYSAGNLAGINFGDYLSRVSAQLMRLCVHPGVQYAVRSEPVTIGIDVAVPCGLIVNELISNALKHAFNGRPKGMIEIELRRVEGNMAELTVSDDGVGVPSTVDLGAIESMGLMLVTSLVRQIHGSITLDRSSGSRFTIRFDPRES
jgi:PAS domain S-box-containing protein